MPITGHTNIVGVIGDPISHSRSPAMHNAAFERLGMDWVYVPFRVKPPDLDEAIRGLKAAGVRGINATIPHKERLVGHVDTLSPEAELIGAVNTLVFDEDGIHGENTDARGFLAAMTEAGFDMPVGRRVVILGAGGAARAVAAAFVGIGVSEIVIANRTPEKAQRLAEDLTRRTSIDALGVALMSDALAPLMREAHLLVNTTSGGMAGNSPLAFDPGLLRAPLSVYDIIYTPPETPLLRSAAENGCRVLNGIGMLVHQGAIAFELWTGTAPPVDVMRKALLASL